MRSITAFILALIFSFALVFNVHAQAPETIWLSAGTVAFKTGETVLVMVNANSVTPIQGFTFQIRYDPACLQPVNAVSPIPGMNGLSLPQTAGLVDASFASTTPQAANGILAEVRFVTLGGCQTNLLLESAALAVRNEAGFAAPLPGVKVGESNIILNVDSAVGASQPEALSGTPLPLDPGTAPSDPKTPILAIAMITVGLVAGLGFGIYKVVQKMGPAQSTAPTPISSSSTAVLKFKHGSRAGKVFSLSRLPCLIGRDTSNDISLNDPNVLNRHAQIYASNNRYYLMDLGGETFINGQAVRKSSALLKPGDVVRLGRSAYFVFGS